MDEKEAAKKYMDIDKPDSIIDGYDYYKTIINDESALKTIKNILKHKEDVKKRMLFLAKEIIKRAETHDDSKLREPEISWLIQMDKEPYAEYGTPEYYKKMEKWKKFFDHHYSNNPHHPGYYEHLGGINGMTIVDLIEMMCDITSYCQKLHTCKASEIIYEQKERFNISEDIIQILINTLNYYYTWIGDFAPKMEESTHSEDISPLL